MSLFSGIGGFDLAAEWMGWESVAQVEKDEFCQKVLEKNFPNTKRYGDIKEFDGTKYRGAIDIVSGGFPCQPSSTAGKRKGQNDDRWLWPEMFRVCKEIRPGVIVWENVAGIITMGFWDLLSEMETEGYQTEAFIIPACSVNALHRRDRVWVVAKDTIQIRRNGKERKEEPQERRLGEPGARNNGRLHFDTKIYADPIGIGQQRSRRAKSSGHQKQNSEGQKNRTFNELAWPTESPIHSANDGISIDLVRLAIGGAGNAIVPQVAYEIFKAIEAVSNGEGQETH